MLVVAYREGFYITQLFNLIWMLVNYSKNKTVQQVEIDTIPQRIWEKWENSVVKTREYFY